MLEFNPYYYYSGRNLHAGFTLRQSVASGQHQQLWLIARSISEVSDGQTCLISSPLTLPMAWQWYVFLLPRRMACNAIDWTWTQKWGIRTCMNIAILMKAANWKTKMDKRGANLSASARMYATCDIRKGEELLYNYGNNNKEWDSVGLLSISASSHAFTTHFWDWQQSSQVECILLCLRNKISRWDSEISYQTTIACNHPNPLKSASTVGVIRNGNTCSTTMSHHPHLILYFPWKPDSSLGRLCWPCPYKVQVPTWMWPSSV